MTNDQMAVNYYKAGITQRGKNPKRPDFVPKKVVLKRTVKSDIPWDYISAPPGEYECECNQWGAVTIKIDGECLGLKPDEFIVIEWGKNSYISN